MNLLINRKTKVIIIKNVKSVKKVLFANMVGDDVNAKIVEEAIFANMVGDDVNAKIVEEVLFANMVGNELLAKIVKFVNMVGNEDNAKIAVKKIKKKKPRTTLKDYHSYEKNL